MSSFISLTQNKDFLRLYRRGKSIAKSGVVVYAMKSRRDFNRVGITTSKKIGNAVERNRSRRIIRAAWQQIEKEQSFCSGFDFVLVARSRTRHMKSTQVKAQLIEALQQLGAVK